MKKQFLFLLLLGLLCSIGNVWAVGTTAKTIASGDQYYSAYAEAKTNLSTNNWVSTSGSPGNSSSSYTAPEGWLDGGSGKPGYGIMNVQSGKTITFTVTNITSVSILGCSNNTSDRTINLSVKEGGTEVGSVATKTTSSNSTPEVLTYGSTLDKTKTYTVTVSASTGNNAKFCQIKFVGAPAGYTVTYNANGHGTAPSKQTGLADGTKATEPTAPTAVGYTFGGWFNKADWASGTQWNFSTSTVTKDTTLYAKWTVNSHTLTWVFIPGSCSGVEGTDYTTNGSVEFGTTIKYPANNTMSRDGYVFAGWSSNALTMPDENLTITALWGVVYDATFAKGDYSAYDGEVAFPSSADEVLYVTLPTLSTDNSYRFDGWKADKAVKVGSSTAAETSAGTMIDGGTNAYLTANTTFTAQWTPKYEVTFNLKGHGSDIDAQYIVSGGKVTEPDEPSASGWAFNGWFKETGCTNEWDFENDVVSTTTVLYAKWQKAATTIFNWEKGEGAQITADNTTLNGTVGEKVMGTMSVGTSVVARKLGSNNIDNNSLGYKLGNNDVCIEIKGTSDFKAGDEVTITGVCGGDGDRYFSIGTSSVSAAANATLNTSTQANKSDILSYTATLTSTEAGEKIRIFRMAGKTMYLYSIKVVRPASYSVTYKPNGPTADDVVDSEALKAAANPFVYTGHAFTGWNTASNGSGDAYAVGDAITTDLTLFAQWQTAYQVTFDLQGHGSAIDVQYVVSGGKVEEPETPTADGYVFGGWFKEAGCANEWDFSSDVIEDEDITLYASWAAAYSVTYSAGTGTGTVPTETDKVEGSQFVLPGQGSMVAPANKYFIGWNDGTNDYAEGANYTMGDEDVTLTAQWTNLPAAVENHYTYVYNDAQHYRDSKYRNPRGGVAKISDNQSIPNGNLCESLGGITSVALTSAKYDGKGDHMNAYIKLRKDDNGKIVFNIASGYIATIKIKMGGYSGANINITMLLNDAGDNITYSGTMDGAATTEDGFTELTYADLAAGAYTLKPTSGSLYISQIDIQTTLVSVSGTITAAGWSTFASSSPLDLSTISGGTAYYASNATGSTVTLTPAGNVTVPAGEGIMVKGTAGETFTIDVAESGPAIDGNLLKGQTTTGNVAASPESGAGTYHYVFGYSKTDASEYGFYNLAATTSVPAGKAYLELTVEEQGAPSIIRIVDEENNATSIEALGSTEKAVKFIENGQLYILREGVVYDALGRKVR